MVLAVACIALRPGMAHALDSEPFDSFNQSPLVQIYGLPAIEGARTTNAGQTRWRFTYALGNDFTSVRNANEYLMLDGETQRATLSIARGISARTEVGVALPYVVLSGGFLDSFVESFHRTFGFPNGGRPLAPRNRLLIRYQHNGRDILNVSGRASGPGDIRLTGAHQLQTAAGTNGEDVVLRASLKLPTGNSDHLLGSGGTDVAMWLSAACHAAHCAGSLRWYGGGGVLYAGDGNALAAQQRHWIGFGSLGIGLPWSENVVIKAQLDAHTSFYRDSALRQLDSNSLQFVVGGDWRLGTGSRIEFALAEDVLVNTAPDVTFFITLRHGYR
jgi:Protein of unknown function (DUF3187)